MKSNKKGFTIVELIIVIAIVAVLAAVLIPTFTNLIKKANDSALEQERTNQRLNDAVEKIENTKWLTWEEFEAKLAEEMGKVSQAGLTSEDKAEIGAAIQKAIEDYNKNHVIDNTGLTEEQVKKIVEKALEGQLTSAQVEGIVKAAIEKAGKTDSLTSEQVKAIVEAAIAKLPKQTGISASEMQKAIEDAIAELKASLPASETVDYDAIKAQIESALAGLDLGLSEEEIAAIIEQYVNVPVPVIIDLKPGQSININNFVTGSTINFMGEWSGREFEIKTDREITIILTGAELLTLKVDAPKATIDDHITHISVAKVNAVNDASFHVFGTIGYTEFSKGHLVVEATGEISVLDASGATADVNIEAAKSSSIQTVITGDNDNVTVANIVASNKVEKTEVGTDSELKNAISAQKPYIVLTSDIVVNTTAADFEYDIVLDGAGHTLTPAAGIRRGINLGGNATIKNITVDGKNMKASGSDYPRGINMYEDNIIVILDNVTVKNLTHYAVNIPMISNPDLTVIDSDLSGYAALNLWANNYSVKVYNSKLTGINNSSAGSNDFATVVLEGDTTNKTDFHSSLIDVQIINSVLTAKATNTAKQSIIGFNSHSLSNTVSLNDCTLKYEGVGPTSFYYDGGMENRLIVDGNQVNKTLAIDCWYSNGTFTADRSAPAGMSTNFVVPFENGWLDNGEGIIIDKDIELDNNIKYQSTGTIYIYLNSHIIKGGKIELNQGVSVVMDTANQKGLFVGGNIAESDNGNGTYTYTCN